MSIWSNPVFDDIKNRLVPFGSIDDIDNQKSIINYSQCNLESVPSLIRLVPKNVVGVKLDNNKLKMINNISSSIIFIFCSHNQIRIIDLASADGIEYIHAPYNNIARIVLPEGSKLSEIDLSHNELKYVPDITADIFVNKLNLSYNDLTWINLEHISVSVLHLTSNPRLNPFRTQLPFQLKYLNIGNCNLTHLPSYLPKTLETLVCSGNLITKLNNLPHNLTGLYASGNRIKYLNKLPIGLSALSISSNLISCLTCTVPNITYSDNPNLKYVVIPLMMVFDLPNVESDCCYYPISILKTKCLPTSKVLLNSSALCIQRVWRGVMIRQKLFYEECVIEI